MEKTHIIMDLKSDIRSKGDSNKFTTIPNRKLEFFKINTKKYAVRLENIIIPTSFYQIDSNYNTFRVEEDTGVTQNIITFTIPEGNYTAAEIIAELESKLDTNTAQANDYVVAFDEKTGKITISYSGGASTTITVQSQTTSTLNPYIGFGEVGSSTTTALAPAGTEAPFGVNLNLRDYLNIDTSVESHNHMDLFGTLNVGVRVPVSQERGDKVYFLNDNGYKIRYQSSNKISSIQCRVVDAYDNEIDFQGLPYSFQMVFYEIEG